MVYEAPELRDGSRGDRSGTRTALSGTGDESAPGAGPPESFFNRPRWSRIQSAPTALIARDMALAKRGLVLWCVAGCVEAILRGVVRVAEGVWAEWRAQERESGKPAIDLLFVGRGASEWSADVLRAVMMDVMVRFEVDPTKVGVGVDELSVGVWRFVDVPEGVWVAVRPKAELFRPLLTELVNALEMAGDAGEVKLYVPPEAPNLPREAELLEARVRIVGERYPIIAEKWASRIADLDALVSAGIGWCSANVGDVAVTLQSGGFPARMVPAVGDFVAEFSDALGPSRRRFAGLRNIGRNWFRAFAVEPRKGWMTLIAGGALLEDAGWEHELATLRAWILENAEHIAYARVRRGRSVQAAEHGQPRIQYRAELEHGDDAGAYEELFVPDAYGLQLVSPEIDQRLRLDQSWETATVGDSVVVQAADLNAWFGSPASTRDGGEGPAAEVLSGARRAFADALFDDEARLRRRSWLYEHQTRLTLSERLVEKLSTLPAVFNVIYHVALVLDDGAIIEPCVVTDQGHVVTVDGRENFDLGGRDIADVLPREQPSKPAG